MVDPRGSGLLFFMFIRPHPYTCLGIEWPPSTECLHGTVPRLGKVNVNMISNGQLRKGNQSIPVPGLPPMFLNGSSE